MTQFPAGLPTGMPSLPTPDARYILPQFEERTPYGFKRQDPYACLLYTSPSPRDRTRSRMPSSA